jgi:hypothetical protein
MGKQKKKTKKRKRKNSSLAQHQRYKKTLTPPLLQFPNTEAFNWRRRQADLLWLAALHYENPNDWRSLDNILEPLDDLVPDDENRILDGRLTSLSLIPEKMQEETVRQLELAGADYCPSGLGHALALFDDHPGAWLFKDWNENHSPDQGEGLEYLRSLMSETENSRSVFSVHLRILSLGRYMRHEKIGISRPDPETIEALKKYPHTDIEEEARHVRQFSKLTYDTMLMVATSDEEVAREEAWAEVFWKQCGVLAADNTKKEEDS